MKRSRTVPTTKNPRRSRPAKGPERPADRKPSNESGGRAAYTVRLSPELATKFNRLRKGRRFREVGEEAVKLWMEKERSAGGPADAVELRESLADTLVFAVLRELRENRTWANIAIQSASLLDPFVSIYVERVGHFREEKLALAKEFAPWIVSRALHYAISRDVIIVADSGTTIKDVLDEMGPSFEKRSAELKKLGANQIQIITNNFPGAESYQAFASKSMLDGTSLADIVPCHLVPGQALREYSAVVGAKAEEYVKHFCDKSKSTRPLICLGLVGSNWVLLEGQPVRPTLLARGDLHRRFKEAAIAVCDETFLVSPLCKMVKMDPKTDEDVLHEFNNDFVDELRREKGMYARVAPANGINPERLKVVTTARTVNHSIVHTHSAIVCASLRAAARASYAAETTKPIEDIPHLVYPHDAASEGGFDQQLRIELPHERTRAPEFRKKYFNIGS